MFVFKIVAFAIYGSAVFLFSRYLGLAHIFDVYFNWSCTDIQDLNDYDYIVVGAGSAGSILAARLADAGEKVLLIEAGTKAPPFLDIPVLAPLLQQTVYDWQYTTVPQENACKGLINNQSKWPMGKILGGSSRLNYMAYVRGHPQDFTGWFEDFAEPIVERGGSLNVNSPQWFTQLSEAVLKGVAEMEHNVGNINRDLDTGFMRAELTMKNGERWSTDRLLDTKHNPTLSIITDARVNKVLFESNKAMGVEFMKFDAPLKAGSRKGVILSAGAVGTPKLLMLSGIGPEQHLKDLKINVVSNLPVGQKLVDHILTGVDLIILNTSLPLSVTSVLNPISVFDYFIHGKGPWTSAGIEVVGTFHSPFGENKDAAPDLQLMVMPVGVSQDNGISLRKAMGISDKVFQEYFEPLTHKTAVSIVPVLLHPKSTGEVKLRSSDPSEEPIIDPKYLSHRNDVDVLISGIQFVKELIKTESMQALGAVLYRKHFPGCEGKLFDSTEYWECYIRHLTLTSYHPAGTCRMGDVVDASFRVYNTRNLFVADASVLPVLPSGNINAAVAMLAEKAARLLSHNRRDNILHAQSQCHTLELLRHVFNFDPGRIEKYIGV